MVLKVELEVVVLKVAATTEESVVAGPQVAVVAAVMVVEKSVE